MKQPKTNLLLTFDYELPLGSITKDFENALFEPTNQLLDLADKSSLSLVFFVDILSYIKFASWNIEDYTIPFKKQVQNMLERGHEVQLHIHPHWIFTKFQDNKFISNTHYSLGDFEDSKIEEIINESVTELNRICSEVIPDYQCCAFRAGGYNLSTKTSTIINCLYKNSIRFDSSMCRGYYYASSLSKVDYRNLPKKANWFLAKNGNFTESAECGIYEVPIAGKPKKLFEIPTRFKLKKFASRAVNRGTAIHDVSKISFSNKIKMLRSSRMLTVDNYTYNLDYLIDIFNYNRRKFSAEQEISFALIGHPKSMGEYSLGLLRDFITYVRNNFKEEVLFSTFTKLKL